MKILLSTLLAVFIFNAVNAQFCTNDHRFTNKPIFETQEVQVFGDIVYGKADDYQGQEATLLYDAYIQKPDSDTLEKRPVVIMIHGGGFVSGNKGQRYFECLSFAQRGYVAFSIGYRLGFKTTDPLGQIKAIYRAQQDIDAAIRHIISEQQKYGIDTNWIFIGGTSAGAITSNNIAYTSQDDWYRLFPSMEKDLGALNQSGNTIETSYNVNAVFNNWGAAVVGVIQHDEMVPQIAFHGELDQTVNIDTSSAGNLMGSRSIHTLLNDNNICSELHVDVKGGHGIYTNKEGAIYRAARASCFFKSIMCSECTDFYAENYVEPNCSFSVGFNDLDNNLSHYHVFPNPSNGIYHIAGLSGNETISIYNTFGERVHISKDKESTINLTSLPNGVYWVKIRSNETTTSYNLIKK
ncbi:MAG: T9SS type A sorting domain-containing protein [Bacteroidia bacterium]